MVRTTGSAPLNNPPAIVTPAAHVASRLRDQIRDKRFSVGDKLDNERELADRFEVSRGTIRQALSILERDRVVLRQQGRGTFVANPAVATDSRQQTALIGALVYQKEDFFGGLLRSASSRSGERGYMLTTGSNATPEEEDRSVEAFINSGIRGVLMASRPEPVCPAIDRLIGEGIPVVLIDSHPPDSDLDFVSVDNRRGSTLAVQHLRELGHERLAYVGHNNPFDIPCQPERIGGFDDACRLAGADQPKVLSNEANCSGPIRALLERKDRPTAILAFNDGWAVRVIGIARELGLSVPDDLSVVGCDDSAMARTYDVPLTSVYPEYHHVGLTAVNLLIDKIEKPQERPPMSLLVKPRIVIRQSTAGVPHP